MLFLHKFYLCKIDINKLKELRKENQLSQEDIAKSFLLTKVNIIELKVANCPK